MTAHGDARSLAYVDKVLRNVFGDPTVPESRRISAPSWLAERETDASRTLLRFLIRWGACRAATSSFNRMLMPPNWTLDGRHVVFAVESQEVCRWGINLRSSRDDVYQQPAGSAEWYREPSGLLPFLLTFCFWNAVNGGLKNSIVLEELASPPIIGQKLTPVDSRFGRMDRSTRLYYADGGAVFCTKEPTGWRLNGGFRSTRMLTQFEKQFPPAN